MLEVILCTSVLDTLPRSAYRLTRWGPVVGLRTGVNYVPTELGVTQGQTAAPMHVDIRADRGSGASRSADPPIGGSKAEGRASISMGGRQGQTVAPTHVDSSGDGRSRVGGGSGDGGGEPAGDRGPGVVGGAAARGGAAGSGPDGRGMAGWAAEGTYRAREA